MEILDFVRRIDGIWDIYLFYSSFKFCPLLEVLVR